MSMGQVAEIMSTRDAANSLGVSVRTVQLWVESGSLQAWKTPGGHRRIYRQSVNNMLAARHQLEIQANRFEVLICAHAASDAAPLVAQLKMLGPELHSRAVYTSVDAITQISEHRPDLLIIDLVQENTSSMQLLDILRSTLSHRTLHIIVVTDLTDEALEKLGGLYSGITKFGKPWLMAQMQRLVRIYMEISKNR